jgi:unsaturated chondroitin disaccharide hydrolase
VAAAQGKLRGTCQPDAQQGLSGRRNSTQLLSSMTPSVVTPAVAACPSLRRALDLCVAKTRRNIEALADRPTTWAFAVDGHYPAWQEGFYEIGNWTSSFITGMALLAWRETEDDHFIRQVERLEPWYVAKVGEHAADTMHDLGFLYSLYAVALHKLTGEARHRELGLKAAQVLAARFIPQGSYIRAWGRMDEVDSDYAGLAIIDCMMNLPLLYWAAEETGDERFKEVAIRHSDTTLRWFVRPDASVFHSYRFDPVLGSPAGGDNYCGRDIESHWARGTAWAIYGFAMGYRYTGNSDYLVAALRIARKFISSLDDELVPVWDFRLEDGAPAIRDSSAAAVAVCGFQELEALGEADEAIIATKRAILERLCSDHYLDTDPEVEGVLKYGQVGDGVGKAKSAYTSWGDYYLMEAVAREMGMKETWW